MPPPANKSSSQCTGPNTFRIIAGQWRGRLLPFAQVIEIRPTSNRVRETLFNWLQNEIVGAHCLDLFTGSGALSFEALSRGAATVTSIELSTAARQVIDNNTKLLNCQSLSLVNANALNWLDSPAKQKYNIVFLDPPFDSDYLHTCCDLLEKGEWLHDNAFIYLESNKSLKHLTLPTNWHALKEKKAGHVFFASYRRHKLI